MAGIDCTGRDKPCTSYYETNGCQDPGTCGNCYENTINNSYWQRRPNTLKRRTLKKLNKYAWDNVYFNYLQGDGYSQTWHNCDVTAPGVKEPNLTCAWKYCTAVTEDDEWGYIFDTEPNVYTSPESVRFAVRCQFKDRVSITCLCPSATSTEPTEWCQHRNKKTDKTLAYRNYSDSKYCWKLNTMTCKPFGSPCYEHGDCDVDLYCKCDGSESGTCSLCLNNQTYPDKTFSPELSNWATCKYGEHDYPDSCAKKGDTYSPNKGLSCCRGVKCSDNGGTCIDDN